MNIRDALIQVERQAHLFAEHQPTLGTLMEEVAELTRSLEGKHDDHPSLELLEIASIAINMMRNYSIDDLELAIDRRRARS